MKKICSTAQNKKLYTLKGDGVIFTPPPGQPRRVNVCNNTIRLYGRRFFTGQKTQPTVSKYWKRNGTGGSYKNVWS